MKALGWVLSIVAAILMVQTLYYKFTGAPESVTLFNVLHMEPYGRYGVGIAELIASILLLLPRTRVWGAILGAGLMSGALFFHFTLIGITDSNGSPLLFIYACTVFTCCVLLIWIERKKLLGLPARK